jgi:hypothetical protein
MFGQERKNETRDVVILLVQGEMAGVEQVDLAIRQVALERLRTGSDERGIVPPPDHKNWWPVLAQPRLPRRIGRDIRPVVVQQIGLDFALAGSRKVGELVSPGVRVITFRMRGADGVTLFGRCERHERIEHFRMRFRIGPILRNGGPLGAQAFLIRIGILDDKRLQPLRRRSNITISTMGLARSIPQYRRTPGLPGPEWPRFQGPKCPFRSGKMSTSSKPA